MRLPIRIPSGRRKVALGVGLLSLTGLGAVWLRASGDAPPTAEVRKGEWVDYVELRGEIKALRSISISAPANAGELQILKLLPSGTAVKAGDVVVEFDRTKRQRTLEEERTALKQQEAEIEKARAQGRLTSEKDRTDLVKSRYDVDRAQLETRKAEVIAPIQGEKNRLDYVERQYRLGEGYFAVVEWLRAGLRPERCRVRLACVVESVRWRRGGVEVGYRSAAGSVKGARGGKRARRCRANGDARGRRADPLTARLDRCP